MNLYLCYLGRMISAGPSQPNSYLLVGPWLGSTSYLSKVQPDSFPAHQVRAADPVT